MKGNKPEANSSLYGKPFIAVTPVVVGPEQVQTVVANGDAKASDICTPDVAAACAKYGVK